MTDTAMNGRNRPAIVDLLRMVEDAIDPASDRYKTWQNDARRGMVRAALLLGVILYVLNNDHQETDRDTKIVNGWGELLKDATRLRFGGVRQVRPVDPGTLLEIKGAPSGWEWGMSLEDADDFLESNALGFKCSDILAYWRGDPSPYTTTAAGGPAAAAQPEPEYLRQGARLKRLRDEFGGDRVQEKGRWKTKGNGAFTKLVKALREAGDKPFDEKSVRKDLTAAAEREKNPYVKGLAK